MSSEFGVSCLENSEKSSEKVVGGWVDSEGYGGVQRYPVWYVSGIEQAQKRGQDTGKARHPTLRQKRPLSLPSSRPSRWHWENTFESHHHTVEYDSPRPVSGEV